MPLPVSHFSLLCSLEEKSFRSWTGRTLGQSEVLRANGKLELSFQEVHLLLGMHPISEAQPW
jgi:hypothetical protein